ncbi:MAG: nickel-dependent lactate racemase [Chloroflexota bacterium]
MNNRYSLPWGNTSLTLDLPAQWQVLGSYSPAGNVPPVDPTEETARRLQEPVGTARLRELATGKQRIALVIDDGSRPTPVARILPAVIEELTAAGVDLTGITVLPALGVHRPMSWEEVNTRLGNGYLASMKLVQHECDNPAELVFLGTTTRGTPVKVNRHLAEADLIISIGCIEPHIIASFGGGYKNLIPGLASRETIAHNHALNCRPDTFNMVGQPIEQNPMRLDLEEAARMIKVPVFIINAVLNSQLQTIRVVCGDPIAAHREGAQASASIYGVPVPTRAEVVITASYPMDQDLRQGVKALANTIRALQAGGVMITAVRAEEGLGVFGLANRKLPLGKNALRALAPVLLPLVPRLKLKGMGEEDKFFLYFALQAMRSGTLLMYAPTIPAEIHERLPFVTFVESIHQAIRLAESRFPQQARVLIFPQGGITYPILPAV